MKPYPWLDEMLVRDIGNIMAIVVILCDRELGAEASKN